MLETIAIIGRPNVGKSSLFNRLINKRKSIVHDTPGITRDRIYAKAKWQQHSFNIIDTGGVEIHDVPFQKQIQYQVQIAILEASIIILVLDGQSDMTNDDLFIADIVKKSNKKLIVAVNKCDNLEWDQSLRRIGVDKIMPISAIHGTGIGNLLDEITSNFPEKSTTEEKIKKLTIIGRPNVGKSSLLNALTKETRSIVSNIPGTTRDSITSSIKINENDYKIIDTAGIMKKSKLVESIDHYALIRAMNSLDESDITLLIIDATNEITKFDSRIIGYSLEKNKPIILIINKWDLIKKSTNTMSDYVKNIYARFHFLTWAPVIFISALKEQRLDKLKECINMVNTNIDRRIKTSLLNEILVDIYTFKPPKRFNGGVLKIKYIYQSPSRMPTFVLFINHSKFLHFSYRRYLSNQLRSHFDFKGVPLILKFISKK